MTSISSNAVPSTGTLTRRGVFSGSDLLLAAVALAIGDAPLVLALRVGARLGHLVVLFR